jgi:hypothetical protein
MVRVNTNACPLTGNIKIEFKSRFHATFHKECMALFERRPIRLRRGVSTTSTSIEVSWRYSLFFWNEKRGHSQITWSMISWSSEQTHIPSSKLFQVYFHSTVPWHYQWNVFFPPSIHQTMVLKWLTWCLHNKFLE